MKPVTFIHTADLHLDMPIRGWFGDEQQRMARREDYRATFRRIVDLAETKEADFLLLAGDFLEYETVSRSTVEWVMETLCQIPESRVLITPGNHDPYREDAYYRTLVWPEHVHIFMGDWEERFYPEYSLRIWGRGFTQFEEKEGLLPAAPLVADERRLMLVHATYQPADSQCAYYPLDPHALAELEMDYVALGHVHRAASYRFDNQRKTLVRYPGSPEALSWKETGQRTVTWGEWTEQGLTVEEIPIHSRLFVKDEIDITGLRTEEDIMNALLSEVPVGEGRSACRKVTISGRRLPDLDVNPASLVYQWQQAGFFFVDVMDHTIPDYDLEQLAQEQGLVGHFVTQMNRRMEKAAPADKAVVEEALYQGLRVLLTAEVKR